MASTYIDGDDPLTHKLRQFLSWLEVTNHSPLTVKTRQWHLTRFRNWCCEREIRSHTEITRTTLEHYRRYLFHKKKADGTSLKANTQSGLLIAVRMFFSWLVRNNMLLYNPASELDLPRVANTLPQNILSPEEVDRIMDQPDVTIYMGIRDRAILETFYSTGIRRCELADLAVNDMVIDKRLLFIRNGKGSKDRVVPIGVRACQWIEKYLLEVRPDYSRSEQTKTLFLTHRGVPINQDVITRIVSHYIAQSGIEKSGSCHLLRHSMATAMLENGADIRYIQQMLGHEKLDSTQIYTRVSILKLKEVHSKTHPARLKKRPAMKAHSGFQSLIDQFLTWRTTLSMSTSTIASNRCDLYQFREWCHKRNIIHPGDVTVDIFLQYCSFLQKIYRKANGEKLHIKTRVSKIVVVSKFYRRLVKDNHVLFDPTHSFTLPRIERSLPGPVLTSAEVTRVMDQPDLRTPTGIRDRAILETFYSTGIRCSELSHLTMVDLKVSAGTVFIRQGKGRKDRLVPIGERAIRWIEQYLYEARPDFVQLPDQGRLFVTINGNPIVYKDLSARVKRYMRSAGITKRGSCHLFRHTMATRMLENGADIRSIQKILGHSCLSTTQIYTKVTITSLSQVHARTHPFEK